ncbi:hypothetical protein CKALI_02390 [Corynebacterium kalinowskii]|uniref:Molybdopterin synthase sulfur carrier subunit n=1 Tax=Corynebacterium kalinowskii TaxID=2675216 RepID=A0A6B8W0Y7_9CORY|nr:MoaD/ThiS family protein [Corynebacterium kalinowskii]QGU01368.1 hypothetical protein CKALI_02390 [Corynebacterium kalinowskii]
MDIKVKFFAAAAAAAGTQETLVQAPEGASVADVIALATAGNEQLGKLAAFCAVLGPDGFIRDRSVPATMPQLELLPPFAGG